MPNKPLSELVEERAMVIWIYEPENAKLCWKDCNNKDHYRQKALIEILSDKFSQND